MKPKLRNFSKNIYSQYGEDGIIQKIFEIIGPQSKICIEFGAWDGILLSNTAHLWKNGWKAILIECDGKKFRELKKNTETLDCICINKKVEVSGENSLDEILRDVNYFEKQIDLLSIDIDGNDYHIFKSISFKPRVIICEYNPTIPNHLEIVADQNNFFGCSSKSLVSLAKEKGYELVSITNTNCIFVKKEEFHKFSEYETSFEQIANYENLAYLITGYDGRYAFSQIPAFGATLPLDQKLIIGKLELLEISHTRAYINKLKALIVRIFNNVIKESLKKIIPKNIRDEFRIYRKYILWLIAGRPIPPHHLYKAKIIKDYGRKFGLNTMVETGTAGGRMMFLQKNNFKSLHSIELDPVLIEKAKIYLKKFGNIKLWQGDSGKMLPKILEKISEPSLFWLDAHYSGGDTSTLEDTDTPIIKELSIILNTFKHKFVILIDDARCFDGTNGYPSINNLEKYVNELNPEIKVMVKDDIIRCIK